MNNNNSSSGGGGSSGNGGPSHHQQHSFLPSVAMSGSSAYEEVADAYYGSGGVGGTKDMDSATAPGYLSY